MEINVDMTKYSLDEAEEKICYILQHTDGLNEDIVAKMAFSSLCLEEAMTLETLKVMMECAVLFDKKQHDYGPGNIAKFGEFGVLVRTNDKLERLINLNKRGDTPANESVMDTWQDLSVYGAIARVVKQGQWKS